MSPTCTFSPHPPAPLATFSTRPDPKDILPLGWKLSQRKKRERRGGEERGREERAEEKRRGEEMQIEEKARRGEGKGGKEILLPWISEKTTVSSDKVQLPVLGRQQQAAEALPGSPHSTEETPQPSHPTSPLIFWMTIAWQTGGFTEGCSALYSSHMYSPTVHN